MKLKKENLVAVIGFMVLGLVGAYFASKGRAKKSFHFYRNCKPAEAELRGEYVQRKRTRRGITTTSYEVRYRFKVDGKEYGGKDVIGAAPRAKMTVYYLPETPSINKIEYRGHFYLDASFVAVPLLVAIVCGIVLILHFSSGRR